MKLTGYETYCTYLALKNHFTKEKYDFFKYNGKVHVSKETFLARRDRFQFEKLARRCEDPISHFVANFLQDKTWVGDMLDDEAFDATKHYVKTHQSMSYVFKNEIEKYEDIRELFKAEQHNGYPVILNEYMRGDVSFHTVIILDSFVGFISKFDAKLKDDFLWSKFSFKARKYAPFLLRDLDKKKFAKLLKEQIKATI